MWLIVEGNSKDSYRFELYPIDTDIKPLNRVYAITKRCEESPREFHHHLISIGYYNNDNPINETDIQNANSQNATHICFHGPIDKPKGLEIIADIKAEQTFGVEH